MLTYTWLTGFSLLWIFYWPFITGVLLLFLSVCINSLCRKYINFDILLNIFSYFNITTWLFMHSIFYFYRFKSTGLMFYNLLFLSLGNLPPFINRCCIFFLKMFLFLKLMFNWSTVDWKYHVSSLLLFCIFCK